MTRSPRLCGRPGSRENRGSGVGARDPGFELTAPRVVRFEAVPLRTELPCSRGFGSRQRSHFGMRLFIAESGRGRRVSKNRKFCATPPNWRAGPRVPDPELRVPDAPSPGFLIPGPDRVSPLAIRLALVLVVLAGNLIWGAQSKTNLTQDSFDQSTRDKIASYLRKRFSLASGATVTVGPLRPSVYPGFDSTTITIQDGKNKQSSNFYVSKDGSYLVEGNIFGLNDDPYTEVERLIKIQGEPSAGAPDAPVTIVEYADLECPHCAEMQQYIEKQLLPKYAGKVRVIFKEFPLFSIHPWAVAAAVADRCAYQINPADFLLYRNLIFQNQNLIKPATANQQLLAYGVQAGLDRDKLSACINSKATLPSVRQDYLEGEKLNVSSTPTFFINGRMVTGSLPAAQFEALVDEALAKASPRD
jgi:protein-disulfide isomerase